MKIPSHVVSAFLAGCLVALVISAFIYCLVRFL